MVSSFCHALCSTVEQSTNTCPLFATIAVGYRRSHGSPLTGGGTCSGKELRPGRGLGSSLEAVRARQYILQFRCEHRAPVRQRRPTYPSHRCADRLAHLTGIHKPGHPSDPDAGRFATITWNQPLEVLEKAFDKAEGFVKTLVTPKL
jgi:hypothetical protein